MKKKILCLLFITSIIFSLMPNINFTSSSINKNETTNVNLIDTYFDNICVSKESEDIITPLVTDKIIIILQINNPYMTVNGVKKEIDPGRGTVPVIIKGRTLVPIRAIIEELGGTVDWDGVERKVTIKFKNKTIELWIDKKTAKVNGTSKELDVPPMILNGRTMLPIRFVTEELGCTVDWEDKTKTVTIIYDEPIKWETIKTVEIGSSGGTIDAEGLNIAIPKNALISTAKIVISKGDGITPYGDNIASKLYKIDGLPTQVSQPIEVTIELNKSAVNNTYVALGVEAFIPSLNKEEVNYQLLSSTVSGNKVTATIPATEVEGVISTLLSQNSINAKDNFATRHLIVPTNINILQSSRKLFRIEMDDGILRDNKTILQSILNDFETAYDKLKNDVGLSWSARTNWPIDIEIKDLGGDKDNKIWGYYTASKLWRFRDYIQLNSRLLKDQDALTEFKVTAGHELFHLLQALYDSSWFLGIRGGPYYWFWEASSVWFEKLMIEKGDYCSKTLADYSGKFMLNGLFNADNSATGSIQDHGYGASMYLGYLINAYGNNPRIVGKIWENIKNGDSIFDSIKKALNVTFWYKNWENFINNYFPTYYNECWNNTKGWVLHKDITERWIIDDTEKDFQHEFKDNYYELSAKTKLIDLSYEKKGFEKGEKPIMNFSISGEPNDIVACIFDYLNGCKEIAYIDKVNSKDIDLSLYPKGTHFLVVIINNVFNGKTDTQQITLKVKIVNPHIDSISPESGNIGTTVTIKGRNFGKTQGASKVIFSSNKVATVLSWSDTEIKVKVPSEAISGNVLVIVNNKESNGVYFKIVDEGVPLIKFCEIVFAATEYMVNEKNEQWILPNSGWSWPPYFIKAEGNWSKNTFSASWEKEHTAKLHRKGNLTVTFDANMSKVISFTATDTEIDTRTTGITITEKWVISGNNIPLDLKTYDSIICSIHGIEACSHVSYKYILETNAPQWVKLIKYECNKDSYIEIYFHN